MANYLRTIRLAMKSLLLHKLRSGLTMLGIVFGVFSVIAMLAIGEGASAQAQRQVLELGATNIIVVSVKPPDDSQQSSGGGGRSFGLQYGLLRSDYRLLTETVPNLMGAVPIREIIAESRYLQKMINARLVGCTTEYADMNRLQLVRGRFLTDQDEYEMGNVCVIASEVASTLFPFEDPLGKTVNVKSFRFRIIGVTRQRTASAAVGGSMSGQDFNKDIYIPLQTFRVRIGDRIFTRMSGSMSAEEVQLNQITLKVKTDKDVLPTSEVVRESLQKTHGSKRDFDIIVPLELLRQADQIRQIFNIVLGSIAAISLVVGGIGIMNIMLATVTERTREIGIRRALGARQRDIIEQFLTETIVLSGAGGLIGVLLGLLTPISFTGIQWIVENFILDKSSGEAPMARMFAEMQPQIAWWSLPVAFGISVGIGIVFGLYPAQSAARLDPIEALRHE
ncbi:ABC transporter permease [Planctellipticum variicoloris]|jgi:putative ABC transport system permease protein|uniref:ABC transporter permease n=1 Tax=Planctellipticum variicoloris TaxID=3064265 RepID=UPI003013D130|nr:ABC transporter permease [Planctomycetaceae bacterium SH412]